MYRVFLYSRTRAATVKPHVKFLHSDPAGYESTEIRESCVDQRVWNSGTLTVVYRTLGISKRNTTDLEQFVS